MASKAKEINNPSNSRPMKWWQWIIVYPTLAGTLIGAVPQYSQWWKIHEGG